MAKNKSELCRFESRFGGGFITNAQFLAESIIAKQAKKENIELPKKFWTTDRWKRPFLMQLRMANALLKLYSVDTIIYVLRTTGKNAYSFGGRWLDPLFTVEQKKRDLQEEARSKQAEQKATEPAPIVAEEKLERPVFVQSQSEVDKLRNL